MLACNICMLTGTRVPAAAVTSSNTPFPAASQSLKCVLPGPSASTRLYSGPGHCFNVQAEANQLETLIH